MLVHSAAPARAAAGLVIALALATVGWWALRDDPSPPTPIGEPRAPAEKPSTSPPPTDALPRARPPQAVEPTRPTPAPVAAVHLSGVVRDPGGAPIAGATVRLLAVDLLHEPLRLAVAEHGATTTDADGRYAFAARPDGTNTIEAHAPGTCRRRTTIPAGDRPNVDITLGPPTVLLGSVRTDRPDAPCTGAVGVTPAGSGPPYYSVAIAPDGSYRFDALPAGVHDLLALPDARRPAPRAGVRTRTDGPSRHDFVIYGGLHIRGQVVDRATGLGIPDAIVTANHRTAPNTEASTGAGGNYLLTGIGPDHDHIHAVAPGYERARRTIKIDPADRRDRTESFKLAKTAWLRGRVVDEAGRPIARATVGRRFIAGAVRGSLTTSDDDGTFELRARPHVPDRTERLYATRRGYAAGASIPFVEKPGTTRTDIDIRLVAAGKLEGTVLWADGSPVHGARITIKRDGEPDAIPPALRAYSGLTDASGRFAVDALRPGLWRVEARHTEAVAKSGVLTVVAGETCAAGEFRLEGGRIAGRVVDEAGEPLIETVLIRRPNGRMNIAMRRSGSDGSFEFVGLTEPAYDVLLTSRLFGVGEPKRVSVGAVDVEIVRPKARRAIGRVTRTDGLPVKRYEVILYKIEPRGLGMRRRPIPIDDDDGRFDVPVPPSLGAAVAVLVRADEGVATHPVRPEPIRIVLRPRVRLSGTVEDDLDQPVMNASVRARRVDGYSSWVRSSSTGAFVFDELLPGRYYVTATLGGFVPTTTEIGVERGRDSTLRLVLGKAGGRLAVRVLDARGKPIPGARVSLGSNQVQSLSHAEATERFEALAARDLGLLALRANDPAAYRKRRHAWLYTTDGDGRWSRSRLGAGRFRVSVTVERNPPIVRMTDVTVGETTNVVVRVE